jgi:hypothetical protein
MPTVQDMIDALSKIEDKTIKCSAVCGSSGIDYEISTPFEKIATDYDIHGGETSLQWVIPGIKVGDKYCCFYLGN